MLNNIAKVVQVYGPMDIILQSAKEQNKTKQNKTKQGEEFWSQQPLGRDEPA